MTNSKNIKSIADFMAELNAESMAKLDELLNNCNEFAAWVALRDAEQTAEKELKDIDNRIAACSPADAREYVRLTKERADREREIMLYHQRGKELNIGRGTADAVRPFVHEYLARVDDIRAELYREIVALCREVADCAKRYDEVAIGVQQMEHHMNELLHATGARPKVYDRSSFHNIYEIATKLVNDYKKYEDAGK